jgi:hypothetical protein
VRCAAPQRCDELAAKREAKPVWQARRAAPRAPRRMRRAARRAGGAAPLSRSRASCAASRRADAPPPPQRFAESGALPTSRADIKRMFRKARPARGSGLRAAGAPLRALTAPPSRAPPPLGA